MYEITLIEHHSNSLVMAHIPCQDDDIEFVAKDLIEQEETAVAVGLVSAYTTITHYYPNRDAFLHYTPAKLIEVTP